ncbi:MAG: O-antigen ligase family protein [Anaerolineales bacterium]|nr:O-antigen ligase family protein [Anaerolineales bacterium]
MADYGLSTLFVVFVLGGVAFVAAWKRPFPVLAALVLLVPFRDLSIRWMNASTDLSPEWVNAISRWWFVLILALALVLAAQWLKDYWRTRELPKLRLLDWLLIAAILVAIIHTLLSPNLRAGFTSMRGYLQPLAVFVLARAFKPTKKQLQALLIVLLLAGTIMLLFELWQVFGWTETMYRQWGYIDQAGRLVAPTISVRGEAYIRPTSTVSGPNELAVDMLLLALGSAFGVLSAKNKWRWGLAPMSGLFVLGTALTFSRSALLGLGAAGLSVIFLIVFQQEKKPQVIRSRSFVWIVALAAIIAVVLFGLLAVTGTLEHLVATTQRLSREYHIQDSIEATRFLLQNPGGVGMGMVEPKGALILMNTEARYHVEGSLFQIAMEMGVWGLALWLAFWGACLARLWRIWPGRADPAIKVVVGTAFSGWIGALVAFVFLPLMQSVSLMVWLWFLLGMAVEANAIEASWEAAGAG